jgi:tetratricopeptide (TPR) repeat protein
MKLQHLEGELNMKPASRIILTALLCMATWAHAAGGDEPASKVKAEDPVITTSRAAIASKDWVGAQQILKTALASNPNNADYHNLYAYATRKGPNPDMDLVFKHYGEALRLDPKHRDAHEYVGEAYLSVRNLAKAREHLAALDRLCFLPCEQYTDLKKAVAQYEAGRKP